MSCKTHDESLCCGQRPVSVGKDSEQGWGQGVWGQVLDSGSVQTWQEVESPAEPSAACVCAKKGVLSSF